MRIEAATNSPTRPHDCGSPVSTRCSTPPTRRSTPPRSATSTTTPRCSTRSPEPTSAGSTRLDQCFAARYEALPAHIKARLVLENDETSYSLPDVLAIHAQVGIPVVWDWLHHTVNNPDNIPAAEATRLAIATWPAGQLPKIHFSSQRLEERQITRRDRATGAAVASTAAPLDGQHAEYINAGEFAQYLATVPDLPFDIMLEAKAKDLALLKLRADLKTLAPLSPASTHSS
ncbi:MAG: hypothetical protein U0841_16340 [Chloroflexia bacterium]